jgi:hypothetical protein
MTQWQKLVLDPAHYAVLKNLDEPKEKEVLAEETGLRVERCQSIIQNLLNHDMVENKVENGVRKIQRRSLDGKIDELRQSLISELIGGNRDAVEEGNYAEARENLTEDLPVEGDTRTTAAQLEAAEKLDSLT